jgi:hypothetical protein
VGPRIPGGITAALDQLEADIWAYLNYQVADSTPDPMQKVLWGGGGPAPEIPPAFKLYRRLRLFAGREGKLELTTGGYYEQPYLALITIERCAQVEREFGISQLIAEKLSLPSAPNSNRSPG